MRACAVIIAMAVAGCSHRQQPLPTPQVTVYFCKAGSDALMPVPFSADRSLQGAQLEDALIAQLLAGPATPSTTVVLFPSGTIATATVSADTATINLRGAVTKPYRGGESDEVALFKSLTYTATSVAGIQHVQVLVDGRKVPTLPGGQFEIDEPLSRGTFSQ